MIAFSKAAFAATFLVVRQAVANPMCVWNQAYQENFEEDKYDEILAGANGCYTLVDPFNGEVATDTENKIQQLKINGNTVGCYMSSGTCEAWRNDYDDIKDHCVDQQWGEWAGEYFVYDIDGMLPHMKARIDQMATWGCDYVEFDNMDWCTDDQYRANYGSTPGQEFPEAPACAAYNVLLCNHAHDEGLKCMSKNTGFDTDPNYYAGGDVMDALTMESYRTNFNWWSDNHLQGFLDSNKPVIIVHYDAKQASNRQYCDYILNKYQERYNSQQISFICETRPDKKYRHYNWAPVPSPTSPPASPPTMPPTQSPSESPSKAPIVASTDPFDVFPYNLFTQTGYQSSDQSIEVLQTHELSGTTDDWDTYIELGQETGSDTNPYKGLFLFQVPGNYDITAYISLKLTVNYYGPGNDGNYVDQRWEFQIKRRDGSKWKWATVGNSGSMQDWTWSLVEFPFEGYPVQDVVNDSGVIKVRLRTVSDNNDVCDIDYLKLSFA